MQYSGLKQHSRESNQIVRESLKSALLILGKEKSFKEISVTELCSKAGVSRMAFYRNYKIISDLFAEIANDLTQKVLQVAGNPFSVDSGENWYRKVFEVIRSQKEAVTLMYQENFQQEWIKNVNQWIAQEKTKTSEKDFLMRVIWGGGFTSVVAFWLNHNLKESPDEMARYCTLFLPHTLEKLQGEV